VVPEILRPLPRQYHRQMETLLQILLFGILGILAVTGASFLILRQSLRRMLRLHPKIKSKAPTTWLLGHNKAARAHRRLRLATQSALAVAGTAQEPKSVTRPTRSEFSTIAESIAQHAVSTETALIQAAATPKAQRAKALQLPLNEIDRIETTVAELIAAASEWRTTIDRQSMNPLDDIHERLTSMRQATDGVRSADAVVPTIGAAPTVGPNRSTSPDGAPPRPRSNVQPTNHDNVVIETE
jgi:hypothetical protein